MQKSVKELLSKLTPLDLVRESLDMTKSGFKEPDVSGLLSEQSDEFWSIQKMAAQSRFISYACFMADLDLTHTLESLSEYGLSMVHQELQRMVEVGVTPLKVRQWWLTEGRMVHAMDKVANEDNKTLNALCYRVLLRSSDTSAFLKLTDEDGVQTVKTLNEATEFSISTISLVNADALNEKIKFMYDPIVSMLGFSEAKLLIGKRKHPG